METSPDRLFISYSRTDGREFAEAFERRLVGEGIRSWRDLKSMGSGDIRPQVLRAIENAEHFVLILSRRALDSNWVKREWSHARMVGKKVSPVLVDTSIARSNLPPWIRREEVYDTTEDERWRQLIRVLDGPGEVRRVPWMRDQLPDEFVPRPAEYDLLKHAVLSAGPEKAVALTTALSGAGGYGKTVLANYLCHDPDVRFEFTDGILRVDIGKERDDVTGLVIDLIEKIDPDAKRPGFQDVVTASAHLAELIGEARILLVIDDVWREAQLRPFLRGGPNCVRLVTTRLPHVLPASYIPIAIDEMRGEEALSLISVKLPEANTSIARRRLTALAGRLGNWAQMLSIANGWIRGRVSLRETVGDAIAKFERRLSARGLTAFDPKDETQRNRAIRACLEASLEDLQKDDLNRLSELAILPEDQSVPLAAIEALWRETGDLDVDETEDLVQRLHRLSLLQNLDLGVRALRLHDNMIWYLRDKIGAAACRGTHNAMIRATRAHCDNQSEWHTLSSTDAYGWQFLIRHLRGAGLDEEADGLLTDYAWIKAKLRASSAQKLYESYLPESPDEAARLIGRAIALSLPTLMVSARELPRQLFGRLGEITNHTAAAVVASAQQDADFRPAPRWPGLTPPGAERLRLVGHQEPVSSASFSPDGTSIVTASSDRTARLWDATTGQEIVALRGHEAGVVSASFSPDGTSIVTASIDGTARLWDATTGQEIVALRGHNSWLRSAAFSPDGTRIVTAAVDGTARLWDARTGQEIAGLRAHNGWVQSVAPSPDGARIVTTSQDGGVRLWDATTGQEIVALRADGDLVQSAAFSPDGAHIVTTSDDRTARLWDATTGQEIVALGAYGDLVKSGAFSPDGARIVTTSRHGMARIWDATTGQEIVTLRVANSLVQSAAFSPDGAHIVTTSDDRTARLWDATTGQEIIALRGHEAGVVSASFSPDGTSIVAASDDRTARLWDATIGREITAPRGHDGSVRSVAFSPDGTRIVTASVDSTARLWDAITGQEIVALRGHDASVQSASFSPDGACIVTASVDGTARLWDATTGQEITSLRGRFYAFELFDASVHSAAFSAVGARIITTSLDGTARLWDATTGEEIVALRVRNSSVQSAAFSPDGAHIVTACVDGTARIWDATTGQEITALRGHDGSVQSAAFSPDGARIITAANDGTARLWDATTGQEIVALRGHDASVQSAAFSPDGARIVTTSADSTARFWDATTGQEITRIVLDASVMGLSVHGSTIALADALGRVHVFESEEFLTAKGSAGG